MESFANKRCVPNFVFPSPCSNILYTISVFVRVKTINYYRYLDEKSMSLHPCFWRQNLTNHMHTLSQYKIKCHHYQMQRFDISIFWGIRVYIRWYVLIPLCPLLQHYCYQYASHVWAHVTFGPKSRLYTFSLCFISKKTHLDCDHTCSIG